MGPYLIGTEHVGLDFSKFINRLVEVASARYYGTPNPPTLTPSRSDPRAHVSIFITARRDRMERRLADWVRLQSRTADPLGLQKVVQGGLDPLWATGPARGAGTVRRGHRGHVADQSGAQRRHPPDRQPRRAGRAPASGPGVPPRPRVAARRGHRLVARSARDAGVCAARVAQPAAAAADSSGRAVLRRRGPGRSLQRPRRRGPGRC